MRPRRPFVDQLLEHRDRGHTLKDIYYAERTILKACPRWRGAREPELKQAFETHKSETEVHVERLQQVFEIIGKRAQGKTCPAIDGILEEGEEIISEYKGTPALDAGLIAAAQAVEHYEITRYGTLKRWAEVLGMSDAARSSRRDASGRGEDRRDADGARRRFCQPRGARSQVRALGALVLGRMPIVPKKLCQGRHRQLEPDKPQLAALAGTQHQPVPGCR